MPELPDVERNRVVVQHHLVGTRIQRVEASDPAVLRNATLDDANAMLRGRSVTAADRIGKWLFVFTDGPIVLIHFGMTGSLRWVTASADRSRYDRLAFVTAHGQLRYDDMRKLQGIWLAADENEADRIVGPHGPDALVISRRQFLDIGTRRGSVKSVLMNQQVIAGLGNMLSDEVLWRARVQPARPAASLGPDELGTLHRATRSTLRLAVRAGAIPRSRSWLSSQRASETPTCPRCHHRLEWSRIAGRHSLWCPNEQR